MWKWRNTVPHGFSLLFKDVLFVFFNIQKDKINEYFIINLLLTYYAYSPQ